MSRTRDSLHVAMFTVPAHGHVNPSLPVVQELTARGHRVSYAIPEPFEAAVAATGATPVRYETTWPQTPEGRREQWSGDDPVDHFRWFLDEAVHVLPQLSAAFDGDRPDVVLCDIGGYPGRVLAHRWEAPVLQLSPAYVAWEGYEQDMAEFLEPLRRTRSYRRYEWSFAAWLAEEGVTLEVDDFVGRPDRCLALIPRALQPHAERVDPSRYEFVGPCVDLAAVRGDWPAPQEDRPLLLVSLGSAFTDQPAFFAACAEAFAGLGWQVVIALGDHVDPAALGPVAPEVELHRWVPQTAVLAHASAFVTHAGMGGAKEGLAAGVPMLAVPQAADQFANADRLVELGVARRVDTADATPQALRAALMELLEDPQLPGRLAALRAELEAEGGAPRAADLIEAQARAAR